MDSAVSQMSQEPEYEYEPIQNDLEFTVWQNSPYPMQFCVIAKTKRGREFLYQNTNLGLMGETAPLVEGEPPERDSWETFKRDAWRDLRRLAGSKHLFYVWDATEGATQ